jgi:hypothetical protein
MCYEAYPKEREKMRVNYEKLIKYAESTIVYKYKANEAYGPQLLIAFKQFIFPVPGYQDELYCDKHLKLCSNIILKLY